MHTYAYARDRTGVRKRQKEMVYKTLASENDIFH